jgi:hypothetical protein
MSQQQQSQQQQQQEADEAVAHYKHVDYSVQFILI